jgi:hypothetical protein
MKSMLISIGMLMLATVAIAQTTNMATWQKDITDFRRKLESGYDFGTTPKTFPVRWEATFLAAKAIKTADGKTNHFVELDIPPVTAPAGTVSLSFSCTDRDYSRWSEVSKGTRVQFSAEWLSLVVAIPGRPTTYFEDTRLLTKITERSDTEKRKTK